MGTDGEEWTILEAVIFCYVVGIILWAVGLGVAWKIFNLIR